MTELLIENYISIEYSLIEEDCIQCLKDIENYIRLSKDIEDTIMNLEMEEFEMEFF